MRIHPAALGVAATGLGLLLVSSAASAYRLQTPKGGSCSKDGSECQVYCTDEAHKDKLAGSMYWNGSVWTDGVKSDEDQDTEAKKIMAAFGNGCS